jgi:hypothetical protein
VAGRKRGASSLTSPGSEKAPIAIAAVEHIDALFAVVRNINGSPPPERPHDIPFTGDCVPKRHGISPRSTISSSSCLSLNVSMARQNPSYL